MPTARRTGEIIDLAGILLSEYRQGTAFHDGSVSDEDGDLRGEATFVVDVDAGGRSALGLVGTLDGLQLAVEAATVAVLYDIELPSHAEQKLNTDFLLNLVNERHVSMEIVRLGSGSFRVTLRAQFRSQITRATAIAVATVTTAALNIIFPPLVLPTLIVGGVASLVGVAGAIQDRRSEKRKEQLADLERQHQSEERAELKRELDAQERACEQQQREIEELKLSNQEFREELDELKDQFRRLEEAYGGREASVIDLEAAREARIRTIDVEVERPTQAA